MCQNYPLALNTNTTNLYSAFQVIPASHCWTPMGDIFCGCQEGQLLKVDTEINHIRTLVRPTPTSTNLKRETTLMTASSSLLPTMPEGG